MIVNAYAVLDGFVTLLRCGLVVLVLYLGVRAWLAWVRGACEGEGKTGVENRCYLLFLLAGLLLVLDVLSWPLYYLLLQSYVPEWSGVMCVYGVTRIGTGSLGVGRFLPGLVTVVQLSKPALVFLSGAWGVLYLINRRTRTAPLTGRVLVLVLATGLVAAADAAAEGAYLVIPKKEEFASAGCCTQAFDARAGGPGLLETWLTRLEEGPWLYAAYYASNLGLVVALVYAMRSARRGPAGRWLGSLVAAAVVALAISALFLVEVGAPHILHLPYHHCPYDLIPRAPESLVAVALFVGGSLAVGWAWIAGWLGQSPESSAFLPGIVGGLLGLASFAYLASLVLMSMELALT